MRTLILVSFHKQSFQFYVKSVLYFVVVLLLMKVGNSELQLFYSALKISISLEAGGWKLKKVGYVVKALLTVFARLDAAPPSATSEKISSRSQLVAALE